MTSPGKQHGAAGAGQVVIRPARPRDLPAVVGVEHAADRAFAGVGLDVVLAAPVAQVEDHATAQAEGRLLVACDEVGEVVGFVRVDVVDGQAHLEQVSVHPCAAGQRIGARLMAAAEQWALGQGFRRVTLWTSLEPSPHGRAGSGITPTQPGLSQVYSTSA